MDHEESLRRREFLQRTAVTAGLAASLGTVLDPDVLVAEAAKRQRRVPLPSPRNMPVDTFVVLMMENRSFDHYLGWLPGADGRQAGLTYLDKQGQPHATRRWAPDFQGCDHPDPSHSWNGGREQFNSGRMDGFRRSGANDDFALSYYEKDDLPFISHAALAGTAYDRFFCSVLGPTFPNREYMHAAQSYGMKDNSLPVDDRGFPDTTIFAACSAKGVSNRYFFNDLPAAGLWGAPGLQRSSRVEEYYARATAGTLPNVSYVDPFFGGIGPASANGVRGDEHPHGDIRAGQSFMADVAHAFMESPQWNRGALFIVYDEWGGFFDHVRPPRVPDDRNSRDLAEDFGRMGVRIPAVVLSPYARAGHVDHGTYGFESILKMIEYRFALAPLTRRDRYAKNIARSFDWGSKPRSAPLHLPHPAMVASPPCPGEESSARADVPAHDLMKLHTSGFLERLGFDYRAASSSTAFRYPDTFERAYFGTA
ncbi:MAG: phospholipase [Actinomycetota bacterium]|nr:phospholipase [Actinomycetota bacterium]